MLHTHLDKQLQKLIQLDNHFESIVKQVGGIDLSDPYQPYPALVKAIIYQQLSGKAATTIYYRFLDLYPGDHPKSSELINIQHEKLCGAGLSNHKAEYMKDIARFFKFNPISLNGFAKLYRSENFCDEEFMLNEAEKWKLLRTLATIYSSRIIDEYIDINGQ